MNKLNVIPISNDIEEFDEWKNSCINCLYKSTTDKENKPISICAINNNNNIIENPNKYICLNHSKIGV